MGAQLFRSKIQLFNQRNTRVEELQANKRAQNFLLLVTVHLLIQYSCVKLKIFSLMKNQDFQLVFLKLVFEHK